jgi:hypothetical protein
MNQADMQVARRVILLSILCSVLCPAYSGPTI